LAFNICILAIGTATTLADPQLKLVKSGTSAVTIDWVILGTTTYSLDLRANSGGYTVGGLQYYITTSPANVVTYGATPLTPLDNPFVVADLTGFGQAPAVGATVNSDAAANTTWYKASSPDYTAFSERSVGTYQFNVGSLGIGAYLFTPIGVLLTYGAGEEVTTFASPGTFSLQVMPEPGTWVLLAAGSFVVA
jgi:hypothetical protein